ncbi:MAG: sigma-54-dependent Fis family transcriptional regulator [Chitinophagales bacterium]|nr:sigma-54-dependent Fis family transcriptional regulator [Chitinophagales bacterium]HAE35552.1 sigma-54-dependent Fis family transcriptional regulator [Bacteroidota bacterium]MCB9021560.1 sigma-54-dependent Fis family transcriptional regulator [Chitinophagales bacterium]MCB9031187.1 sigma-54-dependent Fis family transcriptional regulator [Chitinophagales bacterium]HPE96962.1 sigma-54 dependent transcriptional regulator [Chitinophagales bacterium]
MPHRVLVIDDDPTFCRMLEGFLQRKGMDAKGVFSGEEALLTMEKETFDIILSDYRLPEKDGIELLDEIREHHGPVPFIIMTSYADIRIAVRAMKLGAYDYVTKPVNPDEILLSIKGAMERNTATIIQQEQVVVPVKVSNAENGYLTGESDISKRLQEHIKLVAPTNISVLIEGESGSGKEYVAKRIHEQSNRSARPFVSIDCGALSKELAASELFGHIKGSFTGAIQDKTGQFEAANGGTLFLDEIGNLSYDIQVQMLRALQERRIRKIGSNHDISVDVRILAATNEDLLDAVGRGDFREDLYHRLNEFKIQVSPLRERPEDIPMFCAHFLQQANQELNKQLAGFAQDVMDIFLKYSWPGNLREMRNVIRRSALLSTGDRVGKDALPPEMIQESMGISSRRDLTEQASDLRSVAGKTERDMIIQTLVKVNYNKSKAAKLLKIDRKTLYNKMKQYEIE